MGMIRSGGSFGGRRMGRSCRCGEMSDGEEGLVGDAGLDSITMARYSLDLLKPAAIYCVHFPGQGGAVLVCISKGFSRWSCLGG